MADNKNQHFVPQHYFKFFSGGDDFICLLLRGNGRVVKTAPIKGQSSKSYFYGDSDTEKQVTDIESKFIPTLKRLRQMEDFSGLSREDHEYLAQAIMFQRTRTLAARADFQPMHDKIGRLMLQGAINADEKLSEEFKQELLQVLPYVTANAEAHQGVRMGLAVIEAHNLLDLECILLKNKTTRPFIFGDAPVVLTNPAQKKIVNRGVLGAKSPGLIVYYPIGPFEGVMLVDRNVYDVKGVRAGRLNVRELRDVEQLNKLQIHASASAVYFHDAKYSDYVQYLWGEVGGAVDGARGEVVEQKNEDGRELILSYERQLPFLPRLSYLRYDEMNADSYFIDRDTYFFDMRA